MIFIKCFKKSLLNHTHLLLSGLDYIFFASFVTHLMKLQQEVSIAKSCAGRLTAGMFPSNFSEGVRSFIQKDEAFQFMSTDKGIPVS